MKLSHPEIKTIPEIKLVGLSGTMSYAENRTHELWQQLMPRRSEIPGVISPDFYSVEIYPNPNFMDAFNPHAPFEKWAAMPVSDFAKMPEFVKSLVIPEGLYAIFHYTGSIQEAQQAFQFIYGQWLPNSGYQLDDRPYFARMGSKYSNTSPDSEEDFFIPIVSG